jgi:hypothetical protein
MRISNGSIPRHSSCFPLPSTKYLGPLPFLATFRLEFTRFGRAAGNAFVPTRVMARQETP